MRTGSCWLFSLRGVGSFSYPCRSLCSYLRALHHASRSAVALVKLTTRSVCA
jgi:hypothetical protein